MVRTTINIDDRKRRIVANQKISGRMEFVDITDQFIPPPPTIQPETATWISGMDGNLTQVQIDILDYFVVNEKGTTNNNLSLTDYKIFPQLSKNGGINGKVSKDGATIATANGAEVYSSYGYEPNGIDSYLDSNFNLATDGTPIIDNMGLGGFVQDFNFSTQAYILGVNDVGVSLSGALFSTANGGNIAHGMNGVGNFSTISPQKGLIHSYRDNATNFKLNIDGVDSFTNSGASVQINNGNFYIGAVNQLGSGSLNYFDGTIASAEKIRPIGFDYVAHNEHVRLAIAGFQCDKLITDIDVANAIINGKITDSFEAEAVEAYILAEKSTTNDNWSLTDYFATLQIGTTDLKGGKVGTVSGGVTFDQFGAHFNGVDGYIDTGFDTSIDGTPVGNNSGLGAFVNGFTTPLSNQCVIGVLDTISANTPASVLQFQAAGDINPAVNSAGGASGIPHDTGLWQSVKVSNPDVSLYKDGVSVYTNNAAPLISIPNGNIYIGARNDVGSGTSLYFDGTIASSEKIRPIGMDFVAHNENVRKLVASLQTGTLITNLTDANTIIDNGLTTWP